eukprot:COSAG01_NODE_6076_length_3866_cov_3.010619_2_plen_105_part_00
MGLTIHSGPHLLEGGAEPGRGGPAILAARGFLAIGDSHVGRHRRLERQNAIDGEDSGSDAGFDSAGDAEPEGGDAGVAAACRRQADLRPSTSDFPNFEIPTKIR